MHVAARQLVFAAFTFLVWLPTLNADDSAPLHRRIDGAISDAHVGAYAERANDYEFLRRLYLDFVGRIPSTDELRAFVADASPSKRARVIGELLASSEFDEHFVGVLDVMLMERRGGSRIPQEEWISFLKLAVTEKWSFDQIVRAIITANGTGDQRGAAKFLIQREVEPNALARDVGRLFFGRDLQCAQCHDHPNITDYEQSEYYGIYAFVSRSYLFEDTADNQKSYVGEKAEGEAEFQSVFLPGDGKTKTIPTLLNGLSLDVEPKVFAGDPYVVAPSKTSAGIPRFSRRAQLARLITHPQNEHFANNIVNRLWAHMLGRGFVHPVDFHHSENSPTHPALMKLLSDELVAMGFDYRELLKQIALSDTYQRTIDFPVEKALLADVEDQAERWQRELDTESTVIDDANLFETQLARRRENLSKLDDKLSQESKKREALEAQRTKLQQAIANARKQLTTQQAQLKALDAAAKAAKQASTILPKYQTLAQSAQEFEQRVTGLQKTIATNKTNIEQQSKKSDELLNQFAEQGKLVASLQGERVGLADMVAEARGAMSVFLTRKQRQQARENELKQRLAAVEYARHYFDSLGKSQAATEQSHHLATKVAAAQRTISALRDSVAKLKSQLDTARLSIESAEKELGPMESSLQKKQESLASLQLVVSGLKEDELFDTSNADNSRQGGEINVAISVLSEKQQKHDIDVQRLTKLTAEQRKKAESLRTRLRDMQSAEAESISQLQREEDQFAKLKETQQTATERLQVAVSELQTTEEQLRAAWQRRYVVRSLNPLTPEQLAGATIEALGLTPRYQNEALAEWEKNNQKKADDKSKNVKPDEKQKSAEIAKLLKKRVDGVVSTYVSMFAAPGGAPQDVFSATADQALFLSNDGRVQNWLSPVKGTLLKRLQSIESSTDVADELYLSILSRPATKTEHVELERYLADRNKDRNKALQEVAWGLLSSLEFRFNH